MIGIHKDVKRIAISFTAALCMVGLPALAQSNSPMATQTNPTATQTQPKEVHIHIHHHVRPMVSSRSVIRGAQKQLRADGFYHGKIDGVRNPQFQAAVRSFQRHNNLAVTGRLDRVTMRHLGVRASARMSQAARSASRSMAYTSGGFGTPTNANIEQAQRILQTKGLYMGQVDGIWNPQIASAIRRYQMQNHLTSNGQLDQATLDSLGVSTMSQPAAPMTTPNEQTQPDNQVQPNDQMQPNDQVQPNDQTQPDEQNQSNPPNPQQQL
jgi:peptidoglycan hydrolase-like protein with peptidoglycan-binding domain